MEHTSTYTLTFTMSMMGHLHFKSSETGITMQLTVITVRLPITAADWTLMGFTLLIKAHTH